MDVPGTVGYMTMPSACARSWGAPLPLVPVPFPVVALVVVLVVVAVVGVLGECA